MPFKGLPTIFVLSCLAGLVKLECNKEPEIDCLGALKGDRMFPSSSLVELWPKTGNS